jgi:hypothetical protein
LRRKSVNKAHFGIAIVLVTIAVSGVFFSGCGKKADPRCPASIRPAAVSDLSAVIRDNAVELNWTVKGNKEDDSVIRIVRSELNVEDGDCPGCPRLYNRLAELSFQDTKLIWSGRQNVTYRDSDVKGGHRYSYKVLLCGPSGTCSGESNLAEIRFP